VNLILASASPRRRELLTQAGFTFDVHPAHIPEDPLPNEDPIAYVTRLARQKAQAVFAELSKPLSPDDLSRNASVGVMSQGTTSVVPQEPQNDGRALAPEGSPSTSLYRAGAPGLASETWENKNPDFVCLGADTTVTLDNQILGKPQNQADAARMLRLLSGRTHHVITGVAIVTAARTEVAAEITSVKFLTLSDAEIAAYIATGEPMDKAGAYAIQGLAARWIPRIEGDYFNVVGLPLALVSTILQSL
jgi:septum formation protein